MKKMLITLAVVFTASVCINTVVLAKNYANHKEKGMVPIKGQIKQIEYKIEILENVVLRIDGRIVMFIRNEHDRTIAREKDPVKSDVLKSSSNSKIAALHQSLTEKKAEIANLKGQLIVAKKIKRLQKEISLIEFAQKRNSLINDEEDIEDWKNALQEKTMELEKAEQQLKALQVK